MKGTRVDKETVVRQVEWLHSIRQYDAAEDLREWWNRHRVGIMANDPESQGWRKEPGR